jgi:hypothetical protein
MSEADWKPWKMTTFGLLLVGATALVTTLVMGYRADREDVKQSRGASRANAPVRKTSVPSQIEVEACQAYAQQRTGDKTMDIAKDVAIGDPVGAMAGTLSGLNDTKRHDAKYQSAYRSCLRQKGY